MLWELLCKTGFHGVVWMLGGGAHGTSPAILPGKRESQLVRIKPGILLDSPKKSEADGFTGWDRWVFMKLYNLGVEGEQEKRWSTCLQMPFHLDSCSLNRVCILSPATWLPVCSLVLREGKKIKVRQKSTESFPSKNIVFGEPFSWGKMCSSWGENRAMEAEENYGMMFVLKWLFHRSQIS